MRTRDAALATRVRDEHGQMAAELAVLMPVVIVVALVVFNLSRFLLLCAAFDRVSLDGIVSAAATFEEGTPGFVDVSTLEAYVERSIDAPEACWVEARAAPAGARAHASMPSLAPRLTRITCTLAYRPWPSSLVLAGVVCDVPVVLRHERSLVVDLGGFEVV